MAENKVKKRKLNDKGGIEEEVPRVFPTYPDFLTAKEVIDAQRDDNVLYLYVLWEETEEIGVVLAEEANVRIPQLVIKYYELITRVCDEYLSCK